MLHERPALSRATDSSLSGDTPTVVARRLQSAACLFFGSIQRTYRTISVGSVNAGHAAHLSSVSLPYKMTPMCCDLSLSTVGSGSTKPSLRRSFSTSPGFPVRNSQPGLTPLLLAYSWSTLGVSSSGLRVIEYMKISRPTRSPRALCTAARFAVCRGQRPSQFVYMKLISTTFPLFRSSYFVRRGVSNVRAHRLKKERAGE